MAEELHIENLKIPVGISSCLLGEKVRYDGGHKGHSYIRRTLGEYFDFRSFCPEVTIGLGIPRKPIRLWKNENDKIRCVSVSDSSLDFTQQLGDCGDAQYDWHKHLCGYILKKDSPSCGMERVKIWDDVMPKREGVGVYADKLIKNFPYLPVEEEGRLGDAILRENFIQRVFAMHRWFKFVSQGLGVGQLADFHARHKLILMSRDQASCRELGQLVAGTTRECLLEDSKKYLLGFMSALKKRASRRNHVNVLQHIQGYLKISLDSDDKKELVRIIENYRKGQVPLIVPITLLNHFFRKHPNVYISNSWYMKPYPEELMLQNAI